MIGMSIYRNTAGGLLSGGRIKWAHILSGFVGMQPVLDSEEKTPVNLRIRASLKARARELGVNLSQTLERGLEREILDRERQAWVEENRAAVEAYNERVEKRGPALAEFRRF